MCCSFRVPSATTASNTRGETNAIAIRKIHEHAQFSKYKALFTTKSFAIYLRQSFRLLRLLPCPSHASTKGLHEQRYQNENADRFFGNLRTTPLEKMSARL